MGYSLQMGKIPVVIAAVFSLVLASCGTPPPAPPTETLELGIVGTWTAPSAAISGTHVNSQFVSTSLVSISATATVAAVEEARVIFRMESAASLPDIAPGTYTLRGFDPLQVMFINAVGLVDPVMSLDGSITITDVVYGPPTGPATATIRPITKLRATFSATFDAPVGLVNGTISIG